MKKRHSAEQLVAKLRQADVGCLRGAAIFLSCWIVMFACPVCSIRWQLAHTRARSFRAVLALGLTAESG